VYNKLKSCSKAEEKSTFEMAIDVKMRLLLYKLVNARLLQSIHGIISTGKEAVILYAEGGR
jgi:RIO kinase 3